MQCNDLCDLFTLFRNDGDQILNASSKLSLSTTLLKKLNKKLINMVAFPSLQLHLSELNFDLQMLYEFIQKTLALKLFNDTNYNCQEQVDLYLFNNLKLLEVHRLEVHVLKGLKTLRSQLEFVTCMRSLSALKEVLELCGGDRTQGYVWKELKEAVFSHNYLEEIDESLEYAPLLEHLDLSHNVIQCIDNLNWLMNLRHLNLGNNRIECIPKFSGPICSNLKTLILRNNYIEQINELSCLNLEYLDLSFNSLIDFDSLISLNNMSLDKLLLVGNPIAFHKHYRISVCRCLSININSTFTLDNIHLTRGEVRVLDSITKCENESVTVPMDSSGSFISTSAPTVIANPTRGAKIPSVPSFGSFHSSTTGITVIDFDINAKSKFKHKVKIEQTSDMEVSATSVEAEIKRPTFGFGLQDSGIGRPISPTDSIGSATSLENQQCLHTCSKRFSESDIDVLSNPSQSSIEVLGSGHAIPICVQPTSIVIPCNLTQLCPDEELKKLGEEMHRSL